MYSDGNIGSDFRKGEVLVPGKVGVPGNVGGLDPAKVGVGGPMRRLMLSTIAVDVVDENEVFPLSSDAFPDATLPDSSAVISDTSVSLSSYKIDENNANRTVRILDYARKWC